METPSHHHFNRWYVDHSKMAGLRLFYQFLRTLYPQHGDLNLKNGHKVHEVIDLAVPYCQTNLDGHIKFKSG